MPLRGGTYHALVMEGKANPLDLNRCLRDLVLQAAVDTVQATLCFLGLLRKPSGPKTSSGGDYVVRSVLLQ